MLELSAVLAAQPDDRRVLLPRLFRFFPAYWEVVAEQPAPVAGARISERVSATRPEALIRISCGERLPLTWISRDDEAQRALFRSLGSDFEVEETDQGAYRSFQLSARRPGGCDPDGSSDS
jgi:hypothetical protein